MFGKKSIFRGLISLIFFASIFFFVLYFLVPNVSLKFFGISFKAEEYLESSLSEAFAAAGVNEEDVKSIAGGEVSELLSILMEKTGKGVGSIAAYITSDEGKELIQNGVDYVNSGAGTLLDYLETQKEEL